MGEGVEGLWVGGRGGVGVIFDDGWSGVRVGYMWVIIDEDSG